METMLLHKIFTTKSSVKLWYFTQLIRFRWRFQNISNKNTEIQTIIYLHISELLLIPQFRTIRLNVS